MMEIEFFTILWVVVGVGCVLAEVILDIVDKVQGNDTSSNGYDSLGIIILIVTTIVSIFV